ncbi:unnamed protein product [marine sediment metagenome]|uniref:Uncharacterized protein n=1 Tax=marine sediment metagenome TaxID=412755 RepID=X1A503_9ZZZZ
MKIRYVKLPTNEIYNLLKVRNRTCWDYFPELRPFWWETETIQLREQIEVLFKEKFNNKTRHYTRLRNSIKAHGMRNPIQVITGRPRDTSGKPDTIKLFPPELQQKSFLLLVQTNDMKKNCQKLANGGIQTT